MATSTIARRSRAARADRRGSRGQRTTLQSVTPESTLAHRALHSARSLAQTAALVIRAQSDHEPPRGYDRPGTRAA